MTQASNAAEGFQVTRAHLSDVAILDGKPERTVDGYLKAHARVARSGIQIYHGHELGRPELGDVKVFRPEREVFSVDAMKSLAHRPLTLNHPRENVNADNWKKYVIGYSGDEVLRDGEHVRIPLLICDSAAIQAATHDGIRELSCGYSADINWSPGRTPSGDEYDATQSAIRGNHIALVENARGGESLKLGDDAAPSTTCWSCAQRIPVGTKICPYCQEEQAAEPSGDIRTHADLENAIKSMVRGKNFSSEKVRIVKAAKRLGKVAMSLLPEDWNIQESVGDAAMITDANYFDKEFSTEKRKALAKTGAAMKSGGYPIESRSDLHNAIQAFGRAKNPAATKAHIIKRAKALGATGDLPEGWSDSRGEAKMNLVIGDQAFEVDEAVGLAFRQAIADARRDAKPKALEQEAGGGQTGDQEPMDQDPDDPDEEEEARRGKQTGEKKDRKDRRDARDGEIAVLKRKLADATAPGAIDKRVEDRQALLAVSLPLLDAGYEYRGKSDEQIMRDVVLRGDIAGADKMTAAEIGGAWRAMTSNSQQQTPLNRMVDGMSNQLRMSDRDAYSFSANGSRNGVYSSRNMSLGDAKAMRDRAYADKLSYQNTAWQGNRGYDPHGRNTNDYGR
jgi:uncharacterized protein